ncbi:YycH protein [Desmospora sp. 8437]|nr:YycH protein [Desmospora sp. 8437]
MKEHLKSLALIFLVGASLLQTGILWYSSPSYQEKRNVEDIPKIGHETFQKKGGYQLISPGEILMHREGKQRRILPGKEYWALTDQLHHARLEDIRSVEPSPAQWAGLMKDEPGLELRFHQDFPANVVNTFFSGNEEIEGLQYINRIWLFGEGDNNRVTIWLISDREQSVLEGTALIRDYTEWLDQTAGIDGELLHPVFPDGKSTLDKKSLRDGEIPYAFYLPKESLPVNRLTFRLKKIDVNDMILILFRNPYNPKKTQVFDSTYIYMDSDSGRTLQHNEQNQTMVYNNPMNDTGGEASPGSDLATITTFMNRHNGWTGDFLLNRVEMDLNNGSNNYVFQLYLKGYPVYASAQHSGLDTIRLTARQGVSTYERSLHYFSPRPVREEKGRLPTQDEVLAALKSVGSDWSDLRSIHPGYQTALKGKKMELEPVWVVQFHNGKQGFLAASEGGKGAKWTGAEPNPS